MRFFFELRLFLNNRMRAVDGKQEIYLEWPNTDFLIVALLSTLQFNVCPLPHRVATEAFETLRYQQLHWCQQLHCSVF